jgi:hypothetical protein
MSALACISTTEHGRSLPHAIGISRPATDPSILPKAANGYAIRALNPEFLGRTRMTLLPVVPAVLADVT